MITAGISIRDIDKIFSDQEQVSRLNDVNQDLLKLLINKSIVLGCRGYYSSARFSLLALKSLWNREFDLDQFRNQDQINQLNKIDCKSMGLLLDKCSITKKCFHELLTNQTIDGLNSVNHDLFSALIDSINQSDNLRFFDTSTFTKFLSFFLTQENVEKFNSISSNSLDVLMSYATIPRGTRSYYLKNTVDKSVMWYEFQDTLSMIQGFFDGLTKEKIENLNKLSSANSALLKLFHNKLMRGTRGTVFLQIFKNETRFDNLNSIDLDLISTLIDGIINKLNLREAEKLANGKLRYYYNPVSRTLSEVFTIFDKKGSTEKFNSMNHELINVLVNLATRKAEIMPSFYCTYKDEEYDRYYRIESDLQHTFYLTRRIFPCLTQDTINILNLNLDLLKALINKNIAKDTEILRCFKNREQVEMLRNLDLDLVKTLLAKQIIQYNSFVETNAMFVLGNSILWLFGGRSTASYRVDREGDRLYTILSLKTIEVLVDKEIIKSCDDIESLYTTISDIQKEVNDLDIIGCNLRKILIYKRFIQNVKDVGELLKKENLITNIQNNHYLTKTTLKNDSLINALGADGIIELISHPKYAESSNHFLENSQLASVLYQKGVIKKITVDYLFDNEKIKNDLKGNEFIKNTIVVNLLDKDSKGNTFL